MENKKILFNKFYLIDMEGLSHGITTLTKKIFYTLYASSNIIIWNDKDVNEIITKRNEICGKSKKKTKIY